MIFLIYTQNLQPFVFVVNQKLKFVQLIGLVSFELMHFLLNYHISALILFQRQQDRHVHEVSKSFFVTYTKIFQYLNKALNRLRLLILSKLNF